MTTLRDQIGGGLRERTLRWRTTKDDLGRAEDRLKEHAYHVTQSVYAEGTLPTLLIVGAEESAIVAALSSLADCLESVTRVWDAAVPEDQGRAIVRLGLEMSHSVLGESVRHEVALWMDGLNHLDALVCLQTAGGVLLSCPLLDYSVSLPLPSPDNDLGELVTRLRLLEKEGRDQ